MTMQWTPEQESAISAEGSTLLVSAAAGSGKTAVLVSRILRLVLEEQVPVDRLLIVTFTKAAAGEMKERLRHALTGRLAEQPENAERIREQLSRLNHSWIMTFHGFCRQLLQRHFNEAGLDPGFQVLDAVEADRLSAQALATVLEEAYEAGEPAFLSFADCYSGNRTDTRLEDMVLDLHTFSRSQPDPDGWLESVLELYRKPLEPDHPWVVREMQELCAMAEEAVELLERAVVLSQTEEGPQEYLTALREDLVAARALEQGARRGAEDWDAARRGLAKTRLSPVGKNRKALVDPLVIQMVKDLREDAWGILKDLQDKEWPRPDGADARDLAAVGRHCETLVSLLRRFEEAFSQLKSEQAMVDYSDLEHMALALLRKPELKALYRQHFRYLFIDEFQDSNGVQEALLKAIENGNNRFMVGDVKQSIYRFRLAEPQLFIEKLNRAEAREGAPERRIDLNRNFRSRREVIDGINAVFGAVMSESLGDVAYDESAALIPGAEYPPCPEEAVRMVVLNTGTDGEDAAAEITAAEWEARAIGAQILQLVGSPLWDARKKDWRTAVWEDCCILLRAVRPWLPGFTRVFAELGIPLNTEGASAGEDAWELQLLVNLLKLMDNRYQDLPLMVTLRSPLGGLTLEELSLIRSERQGMPFHEAFRQAAEESGPLGQKLRDFSRRLEVWREHCRSRGVGAFLWRLYEEEGLQLYCTAMPGGESRRERLLWALRQADSRTGQPADAPGAFAEHLEALLAAGELPSGPVRKEGAGVRLMSIHRSKGLEFPVVFMAGLGRKFNTADQRQEILKHRSLGFGLRYVDAVKRIRRDTLLTKQIKAAVGTENLSEEMRILYVGMTRAMDRLYLTGSLRNPEKRFSHWAKGPERFFLKNGGCYLDWILPPLVASGNLREPCEEVAVPAGGSAVRLSVRVPERVLPAVRTEEGRQPSEPEGSWVLENWPWRYPHGDRSVPSKLTVTEINRLQQTAEVPRRPHCRPEAEESEAGLTGMELGTLHHLVLQHLDLKGGLDEAGIGAQLQRMVQECLLAPQDVEQIRTDWLAGLFRSTLGQRLLRSETVLREIPFVILRDYQALGGDTPGEVLVQGVVDCCFKESGGWVLLDYKTDAFSETMQAERRYGRQIRLYRDALEELTGEPVLESWLYLLKSGDTVPIR